MWKIVLFYIASVLIAFVVGSMYMGLKLQKKYDLYRMGLGEHPFKEDDDPYGNDNIRRNFWDYM